MHFSRNPLRKVKSKATQRKNLVFATKIAFLVGIFGIWLVGVNLAQAQSTTTPSSTQASSSSNTTSVVTAPSNGQPVQQKSKTTTTNASQPTTQLNTVVVEGTELTPVDQAQQNLNNIAGGTALVKSSDVSNQALRNLGDLLAYQPGVYAEDAGSTGAPKISIRGSGINTGHNYWRTGIYYLFDGLPVTSPSGTPFEQWSPYDYSYTEVLKGANGLVYGAEDLGGAINFVPFTGYDAYAYEARFDAGSFGYYSTHLSSGQVVGPADYYVGLTAYTAQNYEAQNESKAAKATSSFGYQITPDIFNRFYFDYSYAYEQETTGITKAQLKSDPTASDPADVAAHSDRLNEGSYWVADKTTFNLDEDSSFDIGEVYHHYPVTGGSTTGFATLWWYDDVSGVLDYKRKDLLFDRDSDTTFTLRDTTSVNAFETVYLGDGTIGGQYTNPYEDANYGGSGFATATVNNDYEVANNVWLTNSLGGVYNRIVNHYSDLATGSSDKSDSSLFNWQGRLGARWDVNPDTQVFTSLSRSVDAPRAFDAGAAFTPPVTPLKDQTATTVEVGTRAKYGIFEGSLSLYKSWIDNELLLSHIPGEPAADNTTLNATPTTNQGVELGLTTTLWRDDIASATHSNDPKEIEQPPTDADSGAQQLQLIQSFTYSNFYYDNDPIMHHDQLPGVPPEFYQAELLYEHPTGFYLGLTTEVASAYYVDYANSFKTDPYAIFGVKVGFSPPKGHWDTYLEFSNLTNENYASSVTPTYNANGQDVAVFYPGDGFAVHGGIEVHF